MANVIKHLIQLSADDPDRIAFVDDSTLISYGDLVQRVSGTCEALKNSDAPIGLLAENDIDWVIADLAVTASGRRFVPMPMFFSDDQLAHIVSDSEISEILCDAGNRERAGLFSISRDIPKRFAPVELLDVDALSQRVIYTSGSTGQPKGVRLGDRQIDFISAALAEAIVATEQDRYLSVLPFPLLLEELCGIHVPILVGGSSVIRRSVAAACASGDIDAIRSAYDEVRPSVSVLVPELLRAWVGALLLGGYQAPSSLRVVAVGGAPVPPQVIEAAGSVGIPCLEGYGLSECGSVVAVNRPGDACSGTVGSVLSGINVEIVEGEIVVDAPSVMAGYLGHDEHSGKWYTGDLGHFDERGKLVVEGRKDAMLVTSFGRNVQPEWIEANFEGDPRVLKAVLTGHGQAYPTVVLAPGPFAGDLLEVLDPVVLFQVVTEICGGTPAYAHPASLIVMTVDEMKSLSLLSPNGRIKRTAVQAWIQTENARSRLIELPHSKDHVA